MKAVLFTLVLVAAGQIAQAAECKLTTDRAACPGKETEAYKPYNGKNPTEDLTKAKDEAGCVADAEKSYKIIRAGTLAKKSVVAKWDGKEVFKKEDAKPCK